MKPPPSSLPKYDDDGDELLSESVPDFSSDDFLRWDDHSSRIPVIVFLLRSKEEFHQHISKK